MTSKKHQNFVSEPMGDKPVTAVPGIGDEIGKSMKDAQQESKQPMRNILMRTVKTVSKL